MCILSQVRATDNGSPPRHTDHSLTINILDVNDNAPVIESQKGYNVSISEVGAHSLSKICMTADQCMFFLLSASLFI